MERFSITRPTSEAAQMARGARPARLRAMHANPAVYDPATVNAMRAAFESACETLTTKVVDSEWARRKLAVRILIHVDRGERNSARLAGLAARDLRREATRQGRVSR